MRVLVVGSGAIGGYVGGSLHLADHQVIFMCRPGTAAKIQQDGLWLEVGERVQQLHPQAEASPRAACRGQAFDFTLVALKIYDTEAGMQPLQPFASNLGALVCLQNGVEAEARLAKLFEDAVVIPGTVTTAVGRPAKNRVIVERLRGMGIGGMDPQARHLADELDQAGLNAHHYADPLSMKWSKLLTNLTANALSAVLDMTPAEIYAKPALFELEMLQMKEALAVMQKIEAAVTNLPGTPVVPLALAVKFLPVGLARYLLGRALASGRGAKMPSLHVDLHSGKGRTEAPYLHGAVARTGQRVGVDTPVNRALADTVVRLASGQLPLDTYAHNPQKFLGEIVLEAA